MTWVLVTGGVCSGIGKGCVAAMLARACVRAGLPATYQKLEPCLQGEIAALPNTHFGEIVRSSSGDSFDGDVARAAFYVPRFQPSGDSDLSLGRLLMGVLERSRELPAPRLHELDTLLRSREREPGLLVVEVGGTAGEMEHRILCEALRRALGTAALHVHVTTLVASPSGRWTSKPAQLSLEALPQPADLVLVRAAGANQEALAPLRAVAGIPVPVVGVSEDPDWPERAVTRVLLSAPVSDLLRRSLGVELRPDPLFAPPIGSEGTLGEVLVVHDGAGGEGYASLAHRLRAWSRGALRIRWQTGAEVPGSVSGVIRIGERPPLNVRCRGEVPVLQIVPEERGAPPRDFEVRPDWQGTADEPTGAVAHFLHSVALGGARERSPQGGLAYADPEFAALYLEASQAGALRDHSVLDALVARALPAGERLLRARLLDVGCGAGRWASRLVAAGAREVVGIEPAPPMAAAAAALRLERFRLVSGPIEDYAPDGTFDAVLASMSLDHVENLAPVLGRLARHLTPHGRLIVTTEHPLRTAPLDGPRWVEDSGGVRSARVRDYGQEGWRVFQWFGHPAPVRVYHRTVGSWVRLLREAGLEPIAVHEPVSDHPRDGGNPRFWLLVAQKPGPRRALVTVDGAAASGKTSLGERLARQLEWMLVDTGQLQRAFAWRWLAESHSETVRVRFDDGHARYFVGTREVTDELGGEGVARACGEVARNTAVSEELSAMLGELTRERCVVTGRAMGRFHDDPVARFFLSAPADVRAARRGCSAEEILERDRQDRERGRLLPPDIDTILFDTGAHALEPLVETALAVIRQRLVMFQGPCPPTPRVGSGI